MNTSLLRLSIGAGLCVVLATAAAARESVITIALVPAVTADSIDKDKKETFEIGKLYRATLAFDLGPIPAGAAITSATLRLVARPITDGGKQVVRNQLVRIFDNKDYKKSIGQLNPGLSPIKPAVNSSGSGLPAAITRALKAGKIELYLSTSSTPNRVSYYLDTVAPSSNRPRLIVSWKDAAPPVVRAGGQLRYRGDPADMTPWRQDAPQGATVSKLLSSLGFNLIQAGPVFRGDEILLIALPSAGAQPRFYGFGWNGNKRWDIELTDKNANWKYLHVDEQGRVLAFRNDENVSVFDGFGAAGPTKRTDQAVAKLRLSTRPAVSAGGIVVFRDGEGYLQTWSPFPGSRELWRSSQNVGLSTMPVLSPRPGDNLSYVMAMGDETKGETKGPVVRDTLTGDTRLMTPFPVGSSLANFTRFHPPLAVDGSDHDWVFLSGYGETTGTLEGYTDFTQGDPSGWREAKQGPVSRCVAPRPDKPGDPPEAIYCVQGGQLRAFSISSAEQKCASEEKSLSAASNLVADGAGNIYFWDQQAVLFHGFDKACKRLFSAKLDSIPRVTDGSEVLELRAGPNGVFYTTSDKELLAIQPIRPDAVTALAANTRYARTGAVALTSPVKPPENGPVIIAATALSFGNFQLGANADVTCSARERVSFGAGFKVTKGGVLRCGIEGH